MSYKNEYEAALLSSAVYANGLNVSSGANQLVNQLTKSKSNNGAAMSQAQAEYFASRFKVIKQQYRKRCQVLNFE